MGSRVQTFKPGELPLVVLALLDVRPMNGSELMGELDRLFSPSYNASPGSVYPALGALAEEKLVDEQSAGRSKSYRLTPSGRKVLRQQRAQLAEVEVRTGVRLGSDGSLEPALERMVHRVMQLSGRVDPDAAEVILDEAVREIERLDGKETS